jgi:Ca-activated chloride channel homolog
MYYGLRGTFLVGALLTVCLVTVFSQTSDRLPASQATPQDYPPIQLAVTVTNKKAFVTGLSQDNFQITVDKTPAKIVGFSNEDLPASVGILLDVSYSMRRLRFDKRPSKDLVIARQALALFFEGANKSNDYFLLAFNDKPILLADWTSETALIMEKFGTLKPDGNTALYDACHVAINKLQQGRHAKRVLILISDGLDQGSHYSFSELGNYLRETGVLLYSVCLPEVVNGAGSSLAYEGWAVLSDLSLVSGVMTYAARAFKERSANEMFRAIASELRDQYTIAIEPQVTTREKKWHKIRVKVSPPAGAPQEMKSLSARTREGFYASQAVMKTPQP